MATVGGECKREDLNTSGGLEAVIAAIESDFKHSKRATVHVAVTGESGGGESTFFHAFWGADDDDTDAAPTKITTEAKMYQYPQNDAVNIWDLPAIGNPNFQAGKYLEQVNFDQYDFFIILSAARFTENDLLLAKEIQERRKEFCFVRSQVDHDLDASKQHEKGQYNEGQALEELRDACVQSLRKGGIDSPQLFLLSSRNPDRFDFGRLQGLLEGDLPALKRRASLLSLHNVASAAIGRKKEELLGEIWKFASASAVAAAVPIPGFSVACDIPMLVSMLSSYRRSLALDGGSIERVAKVVGKPVEELRSVVKSTFGLEVSVSTIFQVLVKTTLKEATFFDFLMQKLSKLPYKVTYAMLETAVNEMAEDSKRMLEKALPID